MAKEPVRNAALAAGGGFVGLAAFQATLALGAPLGRGPRGEAPAGPAHRQRRRGRLSCANRADRAGSRRVPGRAITGDVLRWGTWALVGLLLVGAVPNFASSSKWERFGWGPVTLILAVPCRFVALRGGPVSEEG